MVNYSGGRLYRGHERLSAEDDPGDFYSTDGFTSFAIDFMEDAAKRDEPFFVYLAPTAPHSPIQARQEDIDRYRGTYVDQGWDRVRRKRFERQKEMGLAEPHWELPDRPFDIPAWEELSCDLRDIEDARMAAYAAMVDRIDQNVARVVEHLEKWGVADNTLIMVCSDNGASPFDRMPSAHRDGSPHPGARNSQWRMGEDRAESRDLARQQPERVQALSEAYNQWIVEIDASRRFSGTEPDTSNYDDWELYENPRTGKRYSGPRGEPPGWHVDTIGDVSTFSMRETGGEGEGDDKGGFTVTCDGARIGNVSDDFVFIRERDSDANEMLANDMGMATGHAGHWLRTHCG